MRSCTMRKELFSRAVFRLFIENNVLHQFFSYDARLGGLKNGRRWSDEDRGFGPRAMFGVKRSENGQVMSYLNINDMKADEAGVYKCRVDFKSAPTRNFHINVTVVGEIASIYIFK